MNKLLFLSLFMLVALALIAEPAFAQTNTNVGNSLLNDIQGLIGGRLGTVIGLAISLFGLWVWLAQQSSFGLLILIAGAAVTAFPGLYGSLASAFKDAFSSSGASTTGAEDVGN